MLSEQGKDLIRLEFHKLIEEKIYPTTTRLLKRLHNDFEDFPIHSESALRAVMRTVSSDCILNVISEKLYFNFLNILARFSLPANIESEGGAGL